MNKPDYHIFVCNSFRVGSDPQGSCNRKGAANLLRYLTDEITDRGINAIVSASGCLNVCERGPVMVVYPAGWWYGEMTQEKIDRALEALEEGEAADELLMG